MALTPPNVAKPPASRALTEGDPLVGLPLIDHPSPPTPADIPTEGDALPLRLKIVGCRVVVSVPPTLYPTLWDARKLRQTAMNPRHRCSRQHKLQFLVRLQLTRRKAPQVRYCHLRCHQPRQLKLRPEALQAPRFQNRNLEQRLGGYHGGRSCSQSRRRTTPGLWRRINRLRIAVCNPGAGSREGSARIIYQAGIE